MTYHIRPAERSQAKPLIGLYSESGCGKTWSALMLARGFVGPTGSIVMIETEAGRGEVYADLLPGGYDVCSMREIFSPENYGDAIQTVEQAGADALIIDSASHEWEGSGGVLAMAAANEAAGKKSMMIWQGPKLAHQRYFVLRLLATPIPLVIVCMRAKYPMKELKIDGKKEWVRLDRVEPVQSDGILYELMIHGWIDYEHRFHGTKYTRDDLKQVIRDCEPISLKTGEQLAACAREVEAPAPAPDASGSAASTAAPSRPDDERRALLAEIKRLADAAKLTSKERVDAWRTYCGDAKSDAVDVAALADLLAWVTTRTRA